MSQFKPMRIAYLVPQYPAVSHSFIRREVLALERRGFEVMRIALRGWQDELVDEADIRERVLTRYVLREGALKLFLAFCRMLLTRPFRLLQAFALAGKMSRGSDRPLPIHVIYAIEACCIVFWLRGVDHLHAHFGTNSAEIAMLSHVLGGPRWSFTSHGADEYTPLIGLPEKIRRSTFIVGISSYARAQLYRYALHEDWPKIKVVRCGVDSAFYSVPICSFPAARRLVCVGRLSMEKGQLLLVDAAACLKSQGADFELVLAGDGVLRPQIEALIASHNLQKNVRVTGWINATQVREEILAARALVLPSFAEGLPVVIMEAMALRRPVISTYVAGIPELVIPGEHGWLVPASDMDALVEAMRICLDAPIEVLSRMGASAHKRVLERHEADAEASKLAKLFSACSAQVT